MRYPAVLLVAAALAAAVLGAHPEPAHAGRADVAALQVGLRALGLYPAGIDGISGPWTRRAVRRFQARRRLAVDGIAGPQTRRALGRRGGPSLGSRAMYSGRRGWDVAALQFLLSNRGYGPGGFDGGFGPGTALAVRRFQAAAGLAVDGVAGPATVRALRGPRVLSAPGGPVLFLRPVRGQFTDGFGWASGRRHTGLDFPAAAGTPVTAAGRGTVAYAGWNTGGYGNLVVVRHRLGYETWYGHLSRITAWRGQAVSGGVQIGNVGSTGRSTGPHLHFEARRFGTPIDPAPRLLGASASQVRSSRRRLRCRPNADARNARDADPPMARKGRC
jgi:peptidoglycan hydrolase-like protein with peptidoglycan-binding domain